MQHIVRQPAKNLSRFNKERGEKEAESWQYKVTRRMWRAFSKYISRLHMRRMVWTFCESPYQLQQVGLSKLEIMDN